ncbi:MAG: nitrogenase cofactor biosynthesis protein NifB [Proteobacteria bacterium]|nr:nitrogenase cofactor biosynthesis protein NifB [Desulfobulbaceae bacterium]MBU4151620.1 nitrogenase cofactor biosynthesis protein NifB [Pseudomonadota bacterium]
MTQLDLSKHPCFNPGAKGLFGRVHLPVAPKCNIKCNYCNRKYDCVNESRPGVTSTVLTPEQAGEYMVRVLAKEPRITVAGIAGPGDPFANAQETMETMRMLRDEFPEIILCLASNGMNIGPYIPELAEMNVSHVTITINAVDPEIGARIYSWVQDGKIVHHGRRGAELLLARQLAAVESLKKHGITVKINTILIPGINDDHIDEVAVAMRDLGADLFNCMALFPNVDTVFGSIDQPSAERMEVVRKSAEQFLPQMRHCTRCRADAVGLLDQDRTEEFRGCLSACASLPPVSKPRPYVAVATQEGVLVNQHLGEALNFEIWESHQGGYRLVEKRAAPEIGGGLRRWLRLARIIGDCRAVLASGIGETPKETLEKTGVKTIIMNGFIETGLAAVYEGNDLSVFKSRSLSCGNKSCAGTGSGCL